MLSGDQINLAAPRSIYPTTNTVHDLDLSHISRLPYVRSTFGGLRINEDTPPLPYYEKWTEERFPELYQSLEKWYAILLDAKIKCEAVEIIIMAHRNVFSRLPIPTTKELKDTFPDYGSEGLRVGTLLLLKKISSLVASEVFMDSFVPPLFVADMTRVYRFSCELYGQINPLIRHMPVSWFCLHQYLESRNSFHIPGEVKKTLDALVESFKLISPTGHLRPSNEFKEIPLFFASWNNLPLYYLFYRKELAPFRTGWKHPSVDEILATSELADSVGLKPEETESVRNASSKKWETSFGGQSLLALKEISQYYTMSIFATTEYYRKALENNSYRVYHLFGTLGPEDHFKWETSSSGESTEWRYGFGGPFNKSKCPIIAAETPMSHRMIKIEDKSIREPINDMPVKYTSEWREQADLIKALPKRSSSAKNIYYFHQIASGPSNLSMDVLLEYFEAHPAYLLNQEYRSYFSAIINSSSLLERACTNEPIFLERLKVFIETLYEEDCHLLNESNLNFERMLWLSQIARTVCRVNTSGKEKLQHLLGKILFDLSSFVKGTENEWRLAPNLLASQKYLTQEYKLSIVDIARLHFILAQNPPTDPNDMGIWLDACEAMQIKAPAIQEALINGDNSIRRALWSLIFINEKDISEALERGTEKMSIAEFAMGIIQLEKLGLKTNYLLKWASYWKKKPWREEPWRENATPIIYEKTKDLIRGWIDHVRDEEDVLIGKVKNVHAVSKTCFVTCIGGVYIIVDWQTGRSKGMQRTYSAGKKIPIHLRKDPSLAPLKSILKKSIISQPHSTRVHIEGIDFLSLDLDTGFPWLTKEGREFRLITQDSVMMMKLPSQLCEDFTIWLSDHKDNKMYGLIAAQDSEGVPIPTFSIDRTGIIRPLEGNTQLRLACEDYYPEAELFCRWGITQKMMLVWLDDDNRVAEIHLPFNNGIGKFTRVIRSESGAWTIDGLDVQLESTKEGVAEFEGHPVYIVARNTDGHPLLLLSSSTPYEIEKRRKKDFSVDWNQILSAGSREGIYQYRILPSGKVEGLTVADNLLLMLWTFYMGRYADTAELAKRWLTPPARPYSEDEQRILGSWIRKDYEDSKMKIESHPSAQSIRLFVIVRIWRHLKYFTPPGKKGKKMSKFAMSLIGPRINSYMARGDIQEQLSGPELFGRQIRGTVFEELISEYDHETILRMHFKDERKNDSAISRRLYKRQQKMVTDHLVGSTKVTLKIADRTIIDYTDDPKWGGYVYSRLLDAFPTTVQTNQIPITTIARSVVTSDISQFFDQAYTLIKHGFHSPTEEIEYVALVKGILDLREFKSVDLCIHYLWRSLNYHVDDIFEVNLLLWLILEEAYVAKKADKPLPVLPSINRRFGLALAGSQILADKFFIAVALANGKNVHDILTDYRKEWFLKRKMHYLAQETVNITPPEEFYQSLTTPWPIKLTKAIQHWSHLSSPMKPNQTSELGPLLTAWSYPIPEEWAKKNTPLSFLKLQLQNHLQIVSNAKAKREKELLAIANKLPTEENLKIMEFARQLHYSEPFSTDECIILALTGDDRLKMPALHYLEAALETAHLERAKKELEECLTEPDNSDKQKQFYDNLNTKHHYLPSMATLPLMISEYYSDCRLRTQPDQAGLIEVLTSESSSNKGSVIQAIMGSGKSKMLAPMWLQMMLTKGRIPFLCVPSSLIRTTISDLQDMMWKRFRTHVKCFAFDRESCTSDSLHVLAETLFLARQEPTVFVCTPRDLHALQLMLKERHQVVEDMRGRLQRFTITWGRSFLPVEDQSKFNSALEMNRWVQAYQYVPEQLRPSFSAWYASSEKLEIELKPILEEADILQSILNLLQNEMALLVDEVATSYDPRNLLSFPLGWQIFANPQAAAMGCKIYFEWLPEYFAELNLLTNMQSLSKESVRQKIYTDIAKKAWLEYRELISDLPSLEIFTAFMFSDCQMGKPMESFIHEINENRGALMRLLAQELAFLKYSLSSGLEGALTGIGHVNYGRSKQDTDLYLAIPYKDANVPKEDCLFKRPWKTILMTCQYYSQGWEDYKQAIELIGFLQGIDPGSKDQALLKAAHDVWGRGFSDANLSNQTEMQKLTEQLDNARTQPLKAKAARILISTFLQSCVFSRQLKLDPSQLTSTPQDIPMMAAKADAMGGTFGFEDTWNPSLRRRPDHSSDASILKALSEPRNQKCYVIPKGGAESFFARLEQGVFNEYMAIVDAGAIFKGLTNEKVAKRLLSTLKGFDSVLFYDETQPGGARLAIMLPTGKIVLETSDKESVKRAFSKLKLTNPFTFYDQARRIGADLDLKRGRAIVTFSDTVTQDDLEQASMRCRGLIDGRHSIAYVIPEEMEGDWTGDKIILAARNQGKLIKEKASYPGICTQLRGVASSIIDKAMRNTSNTFVRHQIHRDARAFLLEEQSNDLVKSFGSLQGMVRSKDALKQMIAHLVYTVEKIVPGTRVTTKAALESVMEWHKSIGTVLPEWVREGESQEDAVQEIDLSKDQDRLRLMEEEYERMLGTRNPKKEVAWTHFDRKLIEALPLGCITERKDMPTLYRLRDALKERGFGAPVYSNILISINLMSTFLGETNSLLTENQKPVHRVLFVKGVKGPKMVLISEGDARLLKEHLLKSSKRKGRGVYLVEPSGAINQRGWIEEEIINLWQQGTPNTLRTRSMLLQVMCFQGFAMLIDRLPADEIRAALNFWTKKDILRLNAIRILFESALDMRSDDMVHYRRSQKLRILFTQIK